MTTDADTLTLVARWHGGDREALDALLGRELPFVRRLVAARMGDELRVRADADDIVQDAMLEVFRHGPRFVADDLEHYRALLARIVENTIRKAIRDGRRHKRDLAREMPLPTKSVLHLGSPRTGPASAADRSERRAFVQLGLELLSADDRDVVLLRQWDGLEFAAIGARLGIAEDAARMRFQRALGRLAEAVKRLRQGDFGGLLPPAARRD